MSKTATKAAEPVEQPKAEDIELTLNEFCARLSETVRRPELISGFESGERLAGRLKDTAAAYRCRFDEFVTTPV